MVPKWFAGDEWHDAQPLLLGCVNAQLAPGLRWHVEHCPLRCPAGGLWHPAQLSERLWAIWAFLNGTPTWWQLEQAGP